ncbi:MAG TPA: hypothetical protein VGU90_08875, partial [Terriglobales bacterium]|nr:hypothetical protein [Terriglobales bacterium]
VLGTVAFGSVVLINHFAGDYGIGMLYYRNFRGTPIAPGEMTVAFSLSDYIFALRRGVTLALGSFFIPFLLAGLVGFAESHRSRALFASALSYSALHFLALPNWQERWFCLFYLSMGVVVGMGLERRQYQLFPVTSSDSHSEDIRRRAATTEDIGLAAGA